jgi:TonB family protein
MNQNINVKIMKKPELTDEEIRSHMQFDKLLQAYKVAGPVNTLGKWFYVAGYVASAILIISTALYFFLPKPNKVNENNNQPFQVSPRDSTDTAKGQGVIQGIPKINKQEKKMNAAQSRVSPKKKEQNSALPPDENIKVLSQFTEAEPVDGYPALYEYFDRELKYPINVRDSIEGVVTVSFAINQDGKPGLIKIENSLGALFDKECQRVIESMPTWKPATIDGKPIATRLSIPLTFKIKK